MTKKITSGVAALLIAVTFAAFSPQTASAGGYKNAHVMGNSSIVIMNGKMAPKKNYTKSQPTASGGGYKKARTKRMGWQTSIVGGTPVGRFSVYIKCWWVKTGWGRRTLRCINKKR
jgi:hypothetical protein